MTLNLLQNRIRKPEQNCITVDNYRQYQYDILLYFVDIAFEYMNLHRPDNNKLEITSRNFYEKPNYTGIYNSKISEITVNVKENDEIKQYLNLYMPTLIDNYHFILNGTLYVPTMFIYDYPLVIKKRSMKINGLFHSITLYMRNSENIAIFTGKNIPLDLFLQLFLETDEELKLYNEFINKFKLNDKHNKMHSENNILAYYSSAFRKFNTRAEIINYLEKLAIDRYSYHLYQTCYPDLTDINLKNILIYGIKMLLDEKTPSFIDLKFKRIIFMEALLRPLFDKVANISLNLSKGIHHDQIVMNPAILIKHFTSAANKERRIKGLNNNYNYNIYNLFSTLLQNKIQMILPGIENPPASIKEMHPSHFGKICPITISSENPGATVSIISGTKLDEFGRFI